MDNKRDTIKKVVSENKLIEYQRSELLVSQVKNEKYLQTKRENETPERVKEKREVVNKESFKTIFEIIPYDCGLTALAFLKIKARLKVLSVISECNSAYLKEYTTSESLERLISICPEQFHSIEQFIEKSQEKSFLDGLREVLKEFDVVVIDKVVYMQFYNGHNDYNDSIYWFITKKYEKPKIRYIKEKTNDLWKKL